EGNSAVRNRRTKPETCIRRKSGTGTGFPAKTCTCPRFLIRTKTQRFLNRACPRFLTAGAAQHDTGRGALHDAFAERDLAGLDRCDVTVGLLEKTLAAGGQVECEPRRSEP